MLPPLVLLAFVRQERAGGAREYRPEVPALAVTRLVLGVAGAATGAVGISLLADWGWLAAHWPWSLPALPATIVGTWFCTFAAGLLWFSVRERDWGHARIGVVPAVVPLALDLVSAVRLRDGFQGDPATALYVSGLAGLLVVVAAVTIVEERRLRSAVAPSARAAL
jgi:hypothetical protein